MGKGDKKSRRGKITNGSYGKRRPRKSGSSYVAVLEKPTKAKPQEKETKTAPKAAAKPKAEKETAEKKETKPKATKTKKTEE